jgi:FkbM family methyltransferase
MRDREPPPATPRTAEGAGFRGASLLEWTAGVVGARVRAPGLRAALRGAYHRWLHLRTGGRGLECELPAGETVRVLPAYRFIGWNPAEYHAFRAVLQAGDTALDVGANVGAYSLLFAQWVSPGGRVLAFEPAPETFAALGRHLALNGVESVVDARRVALSDGAGTAAFAADGVSGANRLRAAGEGGGGVAVATVSLDELCETERLAPRLVKVDVEGAELAVLRGARETIRRQGDRMALFVELHPTVWKEMGIGRGEVAEEIRRQGLRCVPLRAGADPWALEGECVRLLHG